MTFSQELFQTGPEGAAAFGFDQVVNAIKDTGGTAISMACDVSDEKSVQAMVADTEKQFGTVDILINNAGHGLQGPFADASLDATLSMVQLDIASLTAVTHIFARDMRARRRGKILLVASLLAYQGVENFAV